jgi:hypothetical protein
VVGRRRALKAIVRLQLLALGLLCHRLARQLLDHELLLARRFVLRQCVLPDETITAAVHFDDVDIQGNRNGSIKCPKFTRWLHSGAVTAIATNFEQSWLLTTSENGKIFLFQQRNFQANLLKPVDLISVDVPEVVDIKPGDYSIEEEKQKSELDRRTRAADEKKARIKKRIKSLRQEYIALQQENAKAPAYKRLRQDDFKIDPFLYDLMQEQSDKIVKEASFATM